MMEGTFPLAACLAGKDLAQASQVVILLHGRGSSGSDIVRLSTSFPETDCCFIAPSARLGVWYPQRFLMPVQDNEPYLSESIELLETLVSQLESIGVSTDRIGFAGFSQGACLALEFVARSKRKFAFVAAMSGALIGPISLTRPERDLKGLRVLIACAELDVHIPIEHVKNSVSYFNRCGAEVTETVFSGSAHTIYPEEISWLREILSV